MGGTEQFKTYGEMGRGEPSQFPGEENEDRNSFLVFELGDEAFAIAVEKAREVIRVPKMSWIPGSHESVKGIINLRGSIIAVLGLAYLLGLPQRDEENGESRIIVIESDGTMVGMLVDSVNEVAAIAPVELEQTMRTLDERQRSIVMAQTTVKDKIVGVLDIDQVVAEARQLQPNSAAISG